MSKSYKGRFEARSKFPGGKGLKIGLAVLAGLIVLLLAAGCCVKFSGRVYPNVTIGDAAVGGMTRQETVETVRALSASLYEGKELTLKLPDRTVTFPSEEVQVSVDAEKAADAAMAYGRSGGPISALLRWLRCGKTAYPVDIADALTLNEAYLRQRAQELAESVKSELSPSKTVYDEKEELLTVTIGTSRRRLDPEALLQAVTEAYGTGLREEASAEYDETLCRRPDLTEFWNDHCVAPQDARYDKDTHQIIREVLGRGFPLEETQQRVDTAPEGSTLRIPMKEMPPEITEETLRKEMFPDKLVSYDSNHTAIPARTKNLELACAAINGTILNAGEVFSFNKTVGERTAAKGYQAATVYTNGGKSEPELGGGVCQVASTIYMCALLADLDVVERTEHMYAVTYVPMGMDATIYWGSLDFRFRNSMKDPIYISAGVSGGQVHIAFYGKDTRTEFVKMTYDTLSTTNWKEVEQEDPEKPADYREVIETPYTGYTAQTYKNFYDRAGTLLRTEKCAFSSYHKRDKVIVVGKPPEEPPEEAETPQEQTETPQTPAETPQAPAETPQTPVEEPPAPAEQPPAETEPPAETPSPEEPAQPEPPAETEISD